jgi:hypothetical protein
VQHVAGTLVEPPVEADEGAELPDRVAGSFLQLRDRLLDVGALLRSVDQRAVSVNTLECPSGPLAGVHRAMSTSVITAPADGEGDWQVVSSHNTLVTG